MIVESVTPADREGSVEHSRMESGGTEETYKQLFVKPEERLRLIEENVRDYAIFVVDPHGRIASWNVGASRILGYAEAEVIGMDCADIFTPEDRARGAVEHERNKAHETGRAEDQRWHVRKDGTLFWGSGVMTALRDHDGQMRGFVKILRDMTAHYLSEKRRQEDQARIAEQERQAAVLEERNRLARDIHDTLAQGFTGITLQLEAAEDALHDAPEQTLAHVRSAIQLARESLNEARRSVRALRAQALDDGDFPTALANYVRQVSEQSALDIRFEMQGEPCQLAGEIEHNLLRIAQEALTNVLRHAKAAHVYVMLAFQPESAQLCVEDDGVGFDPDAVTGDSHFGLLGMRERAASIEGIFSLSSAAGQGTRLKITVPLQTPVHAISSVSPA